MVAIASIEERNSEYLPIDATVIFVLYDGDDTIDVLRGAMKSKEEAEKYLKEWHPDILIVDGPILEMEKDRRREALEKVYDTFEYTPPPKGY